MSSFGGWRAGAAQGFAWVALLGLSCGLAACGRQVTPATNAAQVFDEIITLERGASRDTAQRQFPVDADATMVAFIEEDDVDSQLRLEALSAEGKIRAAVSVESRMSGGGIEVAAIDVKRNDRLVVRLEAPQDFATPPRVRLKLVRYDAANIQPAALARLRALRAWTVATAMDMSTDTMRTTGLAEFAAAAQHFRSADGDAHLAAWLSAVRANAGYGFNIDNKMAYTEAMRASQEFEKLGEARNAGRARITAAAALLEIGTDSAAREPSAAEAWTLAERLLRPLEDDPALSVRDRSNATIFRGELAYYRKDFPEAVRLNKLAYQAFEGIGDRDGTRVTLANIGVYAGESGDWRECARVFDALLTRIGELQLPERRLTYIDNDAYAHMSLGNTDVAIERYLWVLDEARKYKLTWYEARALEGLGRSYWERGDLAQAAVYIERAGKLRETLDDAGGLMVNKSIAGSIARESGDVKKALKLHREALAMNVTNDARLRGYAIIGRDHAAAGEYDEAIARYRESLALKQSPPVPWRIRTVELSLAESLLARKGRKSRDVDEAFAIAERGVRGAVADGDISQELAARKILAQSLAARGSAAEARSEYDRAIALIFRYRAMTASPEQQAVALTRLQDTFRGYTDLLMRGAAARRADELLPATEDEATALHVLESVRSVSFDAVRMAPTDAATQDEIDDLLRQMAVKRVTLSGYLDRPGAPAAIVDGLRLEIANLRARIDTARARSGAPRADDPLTPELLRAWPALPRGVVQLSYALGTRSAYLWVRDASGLRTTALSQHPAVIEREIDRLARLRSDVDIPDDPRELARISRWLLPAGAFAADAGRLEIVAEGKLATIPFAALIAAGEPARRLAETHAIVMIGSMLEGDGAPAPSRHTVRLIAVEAGHMAGGTDDSRAVFPPLASANSESRAIADLFGRGGHAADVQLLSGAAGSASAVRAAWSRGAGVFHFATHGLADLRQPLASLLMLPATDQTGNTTYLTAGQVQSWTGAADLVYLSACETAVGPARFAEGIPGLQRAFLRAGAQGVIATLWPIEDPYARKFSMEFYQKYTAGASAPQALSETQRAWLAPLPGVGAAEQAHRRMTAWAHAYYRR